MPSKTNGDSDFGLLYAVDDELALYGWLTNTGIKIVVAIETPVGGEVEGGMALVREGDVKGVSTIPRGRGALLRAGGDHWLRKWVYCMEDMANGMQVFKALQTAYISLVCNPFYENDEIRPIESRRFLMDVKRIAEGWRPGVTV
jgi:hypothetical protein